MMNFNLNDNSLLANGIFNNGNAGKAENVSVSVKRKGPEDPANGPAVKFLFTDATGGTIDDGYFRFELDHARSDADNQKTARMRFGRLLSIANCLVPQGFQYPDTSNMTPTQIEDVLLNTIEHHASPEKKMNIFVNYGRKANPSRFLRVRTFDFVEPAGTPAEKSRLKPKNDDNMEQLQADAPANQPTNTGFGSIPPATGNAGFWGGQQ